MTKLICATPVPLLFSKKQYTNCLGTVLGIIDKLSFSNRTHREWPGRRVIHSRGLHLTPLDTSFHVLVSQMKTATADCDIVSA
jgi:hypothetical protein